MTGWNTDRGHQPILLTILVLLIGVVAILLFAGLVLFTQLPVFLDVALLFLAFILGLVPALFLLLPRLSVPLQAAKRPAHRFTSHGPTADLLVYLFADRVVAPSRNPISFARAPCRDKTVKLAGLAATLFASAFVSLQQRGLVSLRLVQEGEKWMVNVGCVKWATPLGLEGGIMKVLGDKGSESTIRDIIWDWCYAARIKEIEEIVGHEAAYGLRDRLDRIRITFQPPLDSNGNVVRAVMQEAVDLGYITIGDARRGALAKWAWGRTKAVGNCETIRRLDGEVDRFLEAWRSLQQREPELYSKLMLQCKDVMAEAQKALATAR